MPLKPAHRSSWVILAGLLAASVLAGWYLSARNSIPNTSPLTSVTIDSKMLNALSQQRIYFGHRSVGTDILNGLESILAETAQPNALRIIKVQPPFETNEIALYHSAIGRNGAPLSKFQEFEDILVNQGRGRELDAVLLKLCFVDITKETDVKALFDSYATMIDRIQAACPDLLIVHVTVPLRIHHEGLRSRLRNWLKGDQNNYARCRFNSLLVQRYSNTGALFDLARIQSTHPDGTRESFSIAGHTGYALSPAYSEDGGHLNEDGARRAAAELVNILSSAFAARGERS
jgi:hypothetical protein